MKKKLISIILAAIFVISLVGCSSAKPEDTVNVFLKNTQSLDFEKMLESMNPDSKGSLDELEDLESDKTTKCLMDYYRKNASKMTYEIKNSEIDGDNATVTVNFKYIDGTDLFKEIISKLFEESIYRSFAGNDMTDEEMQDLFVEVINGYEGEDIFDTKTVEIYCIKKDNKWYIDDAGDDFIDVIFCNSESYFDTLE